jgi:DNA polymerase V
VFVTTNRFREDLPQYADSYTEQLNMPTADTLEIVSAAIRALEHIYREGYSYKKSGVILTDISRADCLQLDLFDEVRNRPQRMALMRAIDHINQSYGANKLCIGSSNAAAPSWQNKCDHRSSNYLTDIKGILQVG